MGGTSGGTCQNNNSADMVADMGVAEQVRDPTMPVSALEESQDPPQEAVSGDDHSANETPANLTKTRHPGQKGRVLEPACTPSHLMDERAETSHPVPEEIPTPRRTRTRTVKPPERWMAVCSGRAL